MTILALISLLVGMVLGQRFKVLILVPAIVLALLLAVGAGIARAGAVWPIASAWVTATASLQVGYLAGIAIRHLVVAARASRLRLASAAGTRPARRPGL